MPRGATGVAAGAPAVDTVFDSALSRPRVSTATTARLYPMAGWRPVMVVWVWLPSTRNSPVDSPPAPIDTMWYSITVSFVGGSQFRVYAPGWGPADATRTLPGGRSVLVGV